MDSRLGYVSGPAAQVLQLASFLRPALMHSTGSGWVRNDPTGALKRSAEFMGNLGTSSGQQFRSNREMLVGQFFQQKPVQNCTPEKASQVHLFRWPNEFRQGILGIYTSNVSITDSCTQKGGTGRHKNHCGYAEQRSCAVSFHKWY